MNAGSNNFFLRPRDDCAIVWLTNKRESKSDLLNQKNNQDLTDCKSSENSFCAHYRGSLGAAQEKVTEGEEIKNRKLQKKKKSFWMKIFCSFSCFN